MTKRYIIVDEGGLSNPHVEAIEIKSDRLSEEHRRKLQAEIDFANGTGPEWAKGLTKESKEVEPIN